MKREHSTTIVSAPLRRSLFWDADPAKIDLEENAQYVIERVLELGDEKEVEWMKKRYDKQRIKEALLRSRTLNDKSRNFWCLYFNLNLSQCTQKQLTRKQSPFWTR